MEEIVQRVTFETTGVDGLNDGLKQLVEEYKKVEAAQDKAFADAGKAIKATQEEIAKVASEAGSAAAKVDMLERSTKSTGKQMSFFRAAMSGAGDAIKEAVDDLSIFGVSIKDARKRLDDARKSLTVYARANSIAGASARAAGKSSAVGFGLARTGALGLRAALGPIGLILTAIVAGFTLLASAAKRSEPIMEAVGKVTTTVNAALDVLIGRVTKTAEALFFLARGEFGKAFDAAKASVSGLTSELLEEIDVANRLADAQKNLEQTLNSLDVRRAKANRTLTDLNGIIDDSTKSYDARRQAVQDFADVEAKLLADEQEALTQNLAILAGLPEVTDEFRRQLVLLGDNNFVFDEMNEGLQELKRNLNANGAFDEFRAGFIRSINLEESRRSVSRNARNQETRLDREQQQRRLKFIEDRRKAEQELADFQKNIRDQIVQLSIDESEGAERIELERKVAQAQIDELERVTKEKFAAAKQTFDLENEFTQLREGIERDATKRTSDFKFAERQKEIDQARDIELAKTELLEESSNSELNLEEFKAAERARINLDALREQRAEAVKEFGANSPEVLVIDVEIQGVEEAGDAASKLVVDRAKAESLQRQEIRLAEAELIEKSADRELSLEQFKEKRKTEILIEGLQERLKILQDQSGENSPEAKLIELEIKRLQQGLDALGNVRLDALGRIRKRIQEAFNLDDATLDLLTQQAQGAFNNIVSGLEAIYERQLAENDRLIEQIDDRIDTLQSALDDELALREQGFANNADLAQQDLDAELERREAAEEQRLEIQRRAARQQLIIDAAQQASSLTLAAANLLASEALKGLPGIIIAGTLGAALIFSTIAKARAQAAQFSSDIPTFRDGTESLAGMLVGPSHEQGGILAHYTDGGKSYVAELEGGEAVTPKKQAQKYQPLLQAIRTDKLSGMTDEKVLSMLNRNPTQGIAQRSQNYNVIQTSGMSDEGVDKIVSAIKGQLQPVMLENGQVAFVEPTGTIRPFKRPIN